ncbi:hypothetical protein MASR2M36_16640 [Providencia sp.]
MKQRELKNKYSNTLSVTCIVTACMIPSFTAWGEEGSEYEFNSGFIIGSKEHIDLHRFNESGIGPGMYSVDVYTNNNWKGRYDLDFFQKENGKLGVCYTPSMLVDFGINIEKLNPNIKADSTDCLTLEQWNAQKDIADTFQASTLRLDISIPQIYEQRMSRGYVSPQFWDEGIPALNVGYMANYYDTHTSGTHGRNDSSAYVGLNAGLSYDGWLQ